MSSDDMEYLNRILDDDSGLDQALGSQKRPERPSDIKAARLLMESLIVPGLVRWGMSEPEARVEAVRVLTWFENHAAEEGYRRGWDNGYAQRGLEEQGD